MNVFGIGLPEMALIFIVALLVFGPKKLPEIGRSLGKAIRGFQDASKEFETEFKKEAERIEKTVTQPMKAALETPEKKALTPQDATPDASATTAELKADADAETSAPRDAGDAANASSEAPEINVVAEELAAEELSTEPSTSA